MTRFQQTECETCERRQQYRHLRRCADCDSAGCITCFYTVRDEYYCDECYRRCFTESDDEKEETSEPTLARRGVGLVMAKAS